MRKHTLSTRIVLGVLAALLTGLPLAESASPVEAKRRSRTVTRTFGNVASITLANASASPATADLYPSPIEVDGLKGVIRDVNVRLNTLTHTFPSDVQVLLVGPRGQTAVLMADVGWSEDISSVTLTLDDEAEAPLPDDTLSPGAYQPTNLRGEAIAFKAPAPGAGPNAALSVFDGTTPNGTWRLFVQDDNAALDPGVFAGGWALEITTKVKSKKRR